MGKGVDDTCNERASAVQLFVDGATSAAETAPSTRRRARSAAGKIAREKQAARPGQAKPKSSKAKSETSEAPPKLTQRARKEITKALPHVSKRGRTMLEHILEHGQASTEDMRVLYNYNDGPSIARDLKDHGVPLERVTVRNAQGRAIAAYRYDPAKGIHLRSGRRAFPKWLKAALVELHGEQCAECSVEMAARHLQIDHRVPHLVLGDDDRKIHPDDFQLLCSGCNRGKSATCEQCPNGMEHKDPEICGRCTLSGNPDGDHFAMRPEDRLPLTFQDDEVIVLKTLRKEARDLGVHVAAYAKQRLTDIQMLRDAGALHATADVSAEQFIRAGEEAQGMTRTLPNSTSSFADDLRGTRDGSRTVPALKPDSLHTSSPTLRSISEDLQEARREREMRADLARRQERARQLERERQRIEEQQQRPAPERGLNSALIAALSRVSSPRISRGATAEERFSRWLTDRDADLGE